MTRPVSSIVLTIDRPIEEVHPANVLFGPVEKDLAEVFEAIPRIKRRILTDQMVRIEVLAKIAFAVYPMLDMLAEAIPSPDEPDSELLTVMAEYLRRSHPVCATVKIQASSSAALIHGDTRSRLKRGAGDMPGMSGQQSRAEPPSGLDSQEPLGGSAESNSGEADRGQ